eukprot:3202678-Karenia_brevis.AAC.1
MREAVNAKLPELSKWLAWCQQEAGDVALPSGVTRSVDRGAEQGEPTASAATGATLGVVARNAHMTFHPHN